jgi:hypothetical protein
MRERLTEFPERLRELSGGNGASCRIPAPSAAPPVRASYGGKNMAYKQDFIPKKDAEFDEFFNQYYRYVNETCTGSNPEWTHVPDARRTELITAYMDWIAAYGKTKRPTPPRKPWPRTRREWRRRRVSIIFFTVVETTKEIWE